MRKLIKFLFITGLVLFLLGGLAAGGVGAYYYMRYSQDLPKIGRISDYNPKAVSKLLSEDGELMAEYYEERRYPAAFEEIPEIVKNSFLAAEDANFYQHPGIDVVSILRAFYANFKGGGTKQGASTITQQIVKSLLLTREKTYERKIKEALLSWQLENALSKDEILTIYLNEIFLGQTSYGVKAAARVHFRKELEDLSIAEAAWLAGLPQRPSYFTHPKRREEALTRQRYVLRQLLRNQMISREEYDEAKASELKIYPPKHRKIFQAPWFVSHATKVLETKLKEVDPYFTAVEPGGFTVTTTASLEADRIADAAVKKSLKELDKRKGWRGPLKKAPNQTVQIIQPGEIYPAQVTSFSPRGGKIRVRLGEYSGIIDKADYKWARAFINEKDRKSTVNPLKKIKTGDYIEISYHGEKPLVAASFVPKESEAKEGEQVDPSETASENEVSSTSKKADLVEIKLPEDYEVKESEISFKLDQTPEVQAAFAVQNALSGEIKAIIGGYDYRKSQFNRATQGLLQPGSAFKPFIYLAAVKHLGYTPATIVPDSPISMRDGTGDIWSPQNYDKRFLGPITLRRALQSSRNVVSVHLLKRVGIDRGIKAARDLGISTRIDRNMSISLGTPEVKLLEIVNSYGAFAAGGWLSEKLIIKSVKDRHGNVLFQQYPDQKQVIEEDDAFIMANMMRGVVENGTAQIIKKLGKVAAGKTGTTNDQNDAWFVGYTPEWVGGAWVGYDVKRTLGKWETGGKAAAPIFLRFMQEFLKDEPNLEFEIPDSVIPVRIDKRSGRLVDPSNPNGFIEYFKSGTEPRYSARDLSIPKDYLSSDEF